MANRRMFDPNLIGSDRFLDMAPMAQVLYFQLMGQADDDGFVGNPKSVIRMSGNDKMSMKELINNGFVIAFDETVVVTHWHAHNKIRKDRYQPTQFQAEYSLLTIDKGNVYRLVEKAPTRTDAESEQEANEARNQMTQNPQPTVTDSSHRKVGREVGSKVGRKGDVSHVSDSGTGGKREVFDYAKYADAWNAAADKNGMTKVTAPKHWNDARKKALKSLCAKQGDDMVIAVMKKAGESTFLGNSGRKWKATFDWFVKPGNFLKVREGNYTDTFEKKGKSHNAPPPDDWFTNQTDEMAAESLQEMIAAGQRGAGG